MYKCLKCNKEFKYESKFNEHKNRKTECSKNKNFNCNICNSNFTYESEYLRHEKTKKHIININIKNVNNDIINNNLENISNLNSINYEEKYNKLLIEISNLQSKYYELQNKNNNLLEKFNLLEKLSSKESNNNEYIQAKEYGNEYFICELNNLINDIHTLVKNKNLENI